MYNLLNEIDQKLEIEFASSDYFRAKPEAFGLDPRSFGEAITDGFDYLIVKRNDDKSLKYYGGFEYVNDFGRQEYGNYVIYSSESTRVFDALEAFREFQNQEETV